LRCGGHGETGGDEGRNFKREMWSIAPAVHFETRPRLVR
jgi:hypothetical protein